MKHLQETITTDQRKFGVILDRVICSTRIQKTEQNSPRSKLRDLINRKPLKTSEKNDAKARHKTIEPIKGKSCKKLKTEVLGKVMQPSKEEVIA
ncbi:hypothetical protein V6N13_133290 [Hibiscus sabdariffa]|uniref:Uncharacterized protein n=1 Tax=Hibiscus sabdariffa TaxID=183260 RepID=A0ABR2CIN0_9ROSI